MDRLVIVDPPDVTMRVEVGKRSVGIVKLRNVMHTMPVAFTIQTSAPNDYTIRPPYATIAPLGVLTVEIIRNPESELHESFPTCRDKFVVKTVVVPGGFKSKDAVNVDWFTAKKKAVFNDTGLKVTFVGGGILRELMRKGRLDQIREVLERDPSVADVADERGKRAMHMAISMNRPELVQILLEYRVNLELQSKAGQTPLQQAAQAGEALITELLLANGAEIGAKNSSGWTSLHFAAVRGHKEVMKLLIEHGADVDAAMNDGRTALHIAVGEGHKHCVQLLLDKGCNVDAQGPDGGTVLHIGAARGHVSLVKTLLRKGANREAKNHEGRTPYQEAGKFGHDKLLMDLLYLGENLREAARKGEMRSVKKFVKQGAVIDGEDQYGWTALQRAAFKGRIDVVKCLVGKGANLHHKDKEGYTALHTAVESCQKDVVRYLLESGANVNAVTKRGHTPLQLAADFNYQGIIRILVKAGALTDVLGSLDRQFSEFLSGEQGESKERYVDGNVMDSLTRSGSRRGFVPADEHCRPASEFDSKSRSRIVTFAC
ncbi:unnamed protein product [Calypogeia fissa]